AWKIASWMSAAPGLFSSDPDLVVQVVSASGSEISEIRVDRGAPIASDRAKGGAPGQSGV
ncbi:MAG: hypothetical protein AAB280_11190, partial [Pseudomonadota bacterium]